MARYSFVNAALFAASAVLATNAVPPVPLDAQIGELHFPITCTIYGALKQTFDTVFTATAPVYGNAGQEIYYTDVVGTIAIPSSITGLAPLVGATQATANVTADLRLENGSPSTFTAFSGTLSGIKFPAGGVGYVRVPAEGTLPPLGPVTLGTPGVAHRIFLGNVQVSIELQNSAGKGVFGPIPVTCGKQAVDTIIGSVNVDSDQGGDPFSPAVGYVPTFPPTPQFYESGSFRFPYKCTFGGLGDYDLDFILGGTIPIVFTPGQQWSLTNGQSFLSIPDKLISLANSAYPNLKSFRTTVTEFLLSVNNATPETLNAITSPIVSTISAHGENVFVSIPDTGYLPAIGPFTAGANNEIISLQAGASNATVELIANDGSILLTLPVTCDVPSPLELIGVPITSTKYDNYTLFGGNQNK